MTIHAGEKAARLRRATASSSPPIVAASPLSSIRSNNDGQQSPLSPMTPLTDIDILGAADNSTIMLPHTTTLPSFRSRRSQSTSKVVKQHPTRQRNATIQQPTSSSPLQAITGHFVFSGVDLPHPQMTEVATLDWDKFNVHQPTSRENHSFPSTVFFIEQPFKDFGVESASSSQEGVEVPCTGIPSPDNTKLSPRRFLPWFLTYTTTPPSISTRLEEQENDTSIVLPDQKDDECKEEEKAKKPSKKKKKKKKGKAKSGVFLTENAVVTEDRAEDGDCLTMNDSFGGDSDEPESEAATATPINQRNYTSTTEGSLTATEEVNEGIEIISCHEAGSTRRASGSLALSVASSSSHSLGDGFVPVRRYARRAHKRGPKEEQATDSMGSNIPKKLLEGLKVHLPTNSDETEAVGHARKVSKTETETSYHTASLLVSQPPSPSFEEQESTDSRNIDLAKAIMISQNEMQEDNIAGSSISTRTEFSRRQSKEEVVTSTHSKSAKDVHAEKFPADSSCTKVTLEQDSKVYVARDCLPISFSSHLHEESTVYLQSRLPDKKQQLHKVTPTSKHEETGSERLQRTLIWRLLLASSSSSSSQISSQTTQPFEQINVPPKLTVHIPTPELSLSRRGSQQSGVSATSTTSRSQLALNLRRHQQRRLNYAWVHLLPSFEDIYPHRSPERDTQLRKLAWLGLEEYVARKIKMTTAKGMKETIVWITHLCPNRSTMLKRLKASRTEPLLSSSAVWLRAVSKTSTSMQSVRAYQMKLLQDRGQKNGTVSPAHIGQDSIKGNPLEWPVPVLPLAPLSPTPLSPSLPYQALTGRYNQKRPSSSSCSSNFDRESSLELQRDIESCMYELKNCIVSPNADIAWLQTLDSIAQVEKEAMESFFLNSSVEWHASMNEGTMGPYGQHTQTETLAYTDFVWPTTPYATLDTRIEPMSANVNNVEVELGNGLSSCEMAEIEEAMFRDYLYQSNQMANTSPRNNRRNGRNITHAKGANLNMGSRSRAPSTCSHTSMGISEGQGKNVSSLGSVRTRSQESKQANSPQGMTNPSTDRKVHNLNAPATKKPCAVWREVNIASVPIQEVQQIRPLEQDKQETSSSIVDANTRYQQNQYESWAKETENRAVRHSLANLQQHLSLVAARNQNQGVICNEEVTSLPFLENQASLRHGQSLDQASNTQQRHLQISTFSSSQFQRRYSDWSIQVDSPLRTATSSAANLASSRLGQFQFQTQQQISQEARKLEQRHLDSFARAMDQSALHSSQAYGGASEEQYKDLARFHAAMAGEWTGQGTLASNFSWDGSRQTVRPPTITLTEPSNLSNRSQMDFKELNRCKMAWSDDEPTHFFKEALSNQAQISWQATIAHAATSTQTNSRGTWKAKSRRSSIQPMETERLPFSSDAIQSTSSVRRGSLNANKPKRYLLGPKQKGKQRDGPSQRTVDVRQSQPIHDPPISTAAERQLTENQLQHHSFPPHSNNDKVSNRCGTGPFAQTIIPQHSTKRHRRP